MSNELEKIVNEEAAEAKPSFLKKYSENIAGATSFIGSSIVLLNGGIESYVAAATFTAAEITLAKWGNKTTGYSAGALLFGAGDAVLAFSNSVPDGSSLQYSLLTMTTAWGIGALRYPLERLAEYTHSKTMQAVADATQPICGTVNLGLRVPGIAFAVHGGQYVLGTAISLWCVADVLAGRLQERVKSIGSYVKRQFSNYKQNSL